MSANGKETILTQYQPKAIPIGNMVKPFKPLILMLKPLDFVETEPHGGLNPHGRTGNLGHVLRQLQEFQRGRQRRHKGHAPTGCDETRFQLPRFHLRNLLREGMDGWMDVMIQDSTKKQSTRSDVFACFSASANPLWIQKLKVLHPASKPSKRSGRSLCHCSIALLYSS